MAKIINIQPRSVGIVKINIMSLRPNLFTRLAIAGHPMKAPSGIKAPIHERFSSDTSKPYAWFFNIGFAGDVHPSDVPAMKPPIVTAM